MPALLNLVIIGLLWIREDNVIIRPVIDILIINFLRFNDFDKNNTSIIGDKGIMAAPFIILVKGARKC